MAAASAVTKWDVIKELLPDVKYVYISGKPGIGKSFFAQQMIKDLGLEPFIVSCDEDKSVQEMLGHYVPKGHEFIFQHGPLLRALTTGGLVVNELPRASSAVKDMFLGIMDAYPIETIEGRFVAHPGFVCVLTGNDRLAQAGFEPALEDRLILNYHMTKPIPTVITHLETQVTGLGKLVDLSYTGDDSKKPISIRKSLIFAKMIHAGKKPTLAAQVYGDQAKEILAALPAIEKVTTSDSKDVTKSEG